MKLRNGFVSNSSSSSFILNYYSEGKKFTVKEVEDKLNQIFDFYEKSLDGRKIERDEIRVRVITGKEYIKKYKYMLEDFEHLKLKDNVKYIEIITEDNSIPETLHGLIDDYFGANSMRLS